MIRKTAIVRVAWAAVLAVPLCPQPLSAAPPLTGYTKRPYVLRPDPDTVAILWESQTNHPAVVRFGLTPQRQLQSVPILPRAMPHVTTTRHTNLVTTLTNGLSVTKTNVTKTSRTNFFYVYDARLEGLGPDATYYYTVRMNGVETPLRQLRIFSPYQETVRFIAYGDSRSNPKVHRALAQHFRDYAPEFILHTGDLVMSGKEYPQWSKEFFEPLEEVIGEVPVFPVPGNHEDDLKNYLAYFPLPGKGRWYSFDAGPVHVLSLDYHFEKATDEQFKFARRDLLGSHAPWKVVQVHEPMFNYGHHNSAWGHKAYLPLFREARVDVILSGHSHLYERFRPLAPEGPSGGWAVTQIITAGGGAELAAAYDHPANAFSASTNHFVAFEVSREVLRGKVVLTNGAVLDSFEIQKLNGGQAPEYLAQSYPGDKLNVSLEVGPHLLGKLASLPTNDAPAWVMITLPVLKTAPGPVGLEINLAPVSARFYELEDAPLRVTTPAAGERSKVIWARVRSTGRKKIKGPELSPELVFQARVHGEFGETLAYGPLSRTSRSATDAARKLTDSRAAE